MNTRGMEQTFAREYLTFPVWSSSGKSSQSLMHRALQRDARARKKKLPLPKKNRNKKISEIRVSKLVRHYTTIEGMHSSPRTQTPTTEPARRTTTAVGTGRPRP